MYYLPWHHALSFLSSRMQGTRLINFKENTEKGAEKKDTHDGYHESETKVHVEKIPIKYIKYQVVQKVSSLSQPIQLDFFLNKKRYWPKLKTPFMTFIIPYNEPNRLKPNLKEHVNTNKEKSDKMNVTYTTVI